MEWKNKTTLHLFFKLNEVVLQNDTIQCLCLLPCPIWAARPLVLALFFLSRPLRSYIANDDCLLVPSVHFSVCVIIVIAKFVVTSKSSWWWCVREHSRVGVEQNPPDNHSGNSVYVHPGGISQPSPLAPPPIYRPSYAKYFYHAMPMNANSSATSSSSLSPSGSETEASTDGQTETRTKSMRTRCGKFLLRHAGRSCSRWCSTYTICTNHPPIA